MNSRKIPKRIKNSRKLPENSRNISGFRKKIREKCPKELKILKKLQIVENKKKFKKIGTNI